MKQTIEDQTETGAKLKYLPIPRYNNARPKLKNQILRWRAMIIGNLPQFDYIGKPKPRTMYQVQLTNGNYDGYTDVWYQHQSYNRRS